MCHLVLSKNSSAWRILTFIYQYLFSLLKSINQSTHSQQCGLLFYLFRSVIASIRSSQVGRLFSSVVNHWGWEVLGLIYEENDEKEDGHSVCHFTLASIYEAFKKTKPHFEKFNRNSMTNFTQLLVNFQDKARSECWTDIFFTFSFCQPLCVCLSVSIRPSFPLSVHSAQISLLRSVLFLPHLSLNTSLFIFFSVFYFYMQLVLMSVIWVIPVKSDLGHCNFPLVTLVPCLCYLL